MIWKTKSEQQKFMGKKLTINRALLYNLVDIVWGDAMEDQSVPSTPHASDLIKKAIERTTEQKYSSSKIVKK